MAELYVRGALESIPGNESNTPTLSNYTVDFPLIGLNHSLGKESLSRDDEVRSTIDPVPGIAAVYDPELSYNSRLYPDLAGFFFSLAFGDPVTTTGNGVITDPDAVVIPAGAYRHVWKSDLVHAATTAPMTAQLTTSFRNTFFKAKGVACSSIGLDVTDTSIDMTADLPALFFDRITDPSITPAYEVLSIHPFLRRYTKIVTWLSGTATSSNISFNWDIPIEKFRSLGIESAYPDTLLKGEGIPTLTGSISKTDIDNDDWDAMKLDTGFASKTKFGNGVVIATTYKSSLWVEMSNAQYLDGDMDELGNKRRHGSSFDFKATSAVAGTPAWTITLCNSTPDYVTP